MKKGSGSRNWITCWQRTVPWCLAGALLGIWQASTRADDGSDWQTKYDQAASYLEKRSYPQAEVLVKQAQVLAESFGSKDPRLMRSLNLRLNILYAQNKLAEAEPIMKRSIHLLSVLMGKESTEVQTARRNYAELLTKLGRTSEAQEQRSLAQPPGPPANKPALVYGERLITFPANTSTSGSVFAYSDPENFREISLGYSYGYVKVPPGKDVRINFLGGTRGSAILQALSLLKPGDIQALGIYESDISGSQLEQIARLRGMKYLEIRDCENLQPDHLATFRRLTGATVRVVE